MGEGQKEDTQKLKAESLGYGVLPDFGLNFGANSFVSRFERFGCNLSNDILLTGIQTDTDGHALISVETFTDAQRPTICTTGLKSGTTCGGRSNRISPEAGKASGVSGVLWKLKRWACERKTCK
jgi:hypothetical protein